MNDSLFLPALIISLTFLLAGFVKGVIGLGLPTVAIGLLGLVMTPAQAVALLVVPSLVTNVWQLFGPGFVPLARRLWPMLAGMCVGAWVTASLFSDGIGSDATTMLGIALVVYAIFGLSAKRFSVPARMERRLSPLIGALTGAVAAATGVFVIPAVPYLQALDLNREELVQALGLSFTVSTLALAAVLMSQGTFQLSTAGVSLAALAPAVCGMLIGQRIRMRVRPETFRLCFFFGLLLLGGHLALKSMM
jgi:uncharacterized protein